MEHSRGWCAFAQSQTPCSFMCALFLVKGVTQPGASIRFLDRAAPTTTSDDGAFDVPKHLQAAASFSGFPPYGGNSQGGSER